MDISLKHETCVLLKLLKVPGALVSLQSHSYDSFCIRYGHRNVKDKDDIQITDKFRIGSNTKMFTGIVILQLYQEGHLNIDDPVSKYLTGIPNGDKITIRQVGSMTSGIFNYFDDSNFQQEFTSHPYRNWLPAELYSIGILNPVYFPPGTDFHYSNTNSVILGLIIERITHNTLIHEINNRIIEPLQLNTTKFQTDGTIKEPVIHGYWYSESAKLKDVTYYSPSWAWASGAISSNYHDMSKFIKYGIGNDKLLNNDASKQQRLWRSHTLTAHFKLNSYYGFHLLKIENFIGHNGDMKGYNTVILYECATKTTLIVVIDVGITPTEIIPADFIAEYIIAKLSKKTSFSEAKAILKKLTAK